MSQFSRSVFPRQVAGLAREIECKLVALGLDWRDGAQMRLLAQAVLAKREDFGGTDALNRRAMRKLIGLVSLMNIAMANAASGNVDVHGNPCWKALASALWAASGQ